MPSGTEDGPKHWQGTAPACDRAATNVPAVNAASTAAATVRPATDGRGRATNSRVTASAAATMIAIAERPPLGSSGSVATHAENARNAGPLRSLVNADTANTTPMRHRDTRATYVMNQRLSRPAG